MRMGRVAVAAVAAVALSACKTKTPEEVAAASVVQISDGFRRAGGVAVSKRHLLAPLGLVQNVGSAQVLNAAGQGQNAKVVKRNKDLDVGLLDAENGGLAGAEPGCSADLADGAAVVTQEFDAGGKATLKSGKVTAWRFHEGRAYLETDLATGDENQGAGVIGPSGKLVGVQSFRRGSSLTYVLPIEYLVGGKRALTVSALGERTDCDGFASKRAEASRHPDPLPEPIAFEQLSYELAFSSKALVGILTMLDKKTSPAHEQPVQFKIVLDDPTGEKKTVATGSLERSDLRWAPDLELLTKHSKEMAVAFGAAWVQANLEPYEYGSLRFRLPFAAFCAKLPAEGVFNVFLMLGDGRSGPPMGIDGLLGICSSGGEGPGDALEREWGMAPLAGAKEALPKKAEKKSKKKKKRRR